MAIEPYSTERETRQYLRKTFAKYDGVVLLTSKLHDKWFEFPKRADEIVQIRDSLHDEMVKVLLNPDPSWNEIEYLDDKIEEAKRLLKLFKKLYINKQILHESLEIEVENLQKVA